MLAPNVVLTTTGHPVLREISERDREVYFKGRKIPQEVLAKYEAK